MVKKIIWTKRANRKFNSVIQYLESEWNPNVVAAFVQRTYDVIETLAMHPELGTLELPDKKIRGFLITKHNRLFYRVSDKEIILLNFFDTRSSAERKKF